MRRSSTDFASRAVTETKRDDLESTKKSNGFGKDAFPRVCEHRGYRESQPLLYG